jgi:uncharacterized protein YcsI (UPF0317 family)
MGGEMSTITASERARAGGPENGREIVDRDEVRDLAPQQLRALIRQGRWRGTSSDLGAGFAQATFVAVPRHLATDFLTFAQRNPRPCPVLEIVEPGSTTLQRLAPGADVRTDMSKYRVFKDGEAVAEPYDVNEYWRDDMVGVLIGCSRSFEIVLTEAGIPPRPVTTYLTDIECAPAGPFHGRMIVSMRPIHRTQVSLAVQVTSRFPGFHGAPVHIGDPRQIGIHDLAKTNGGLGPVEIGPDDVPVFWGCSVTPSQVAMDARIEYMIVSYPGHMLVCDLPARTMAISS